MFTNVHKKRVDHPTGTTEKGLDLSPSGLEHSIPPTLSRGPHPGEKMGNRFEMEAFMGNYGEIMGKS